MPPKKATREEILKKKGELEKLRYQRMKHITEKNIQKKKEFKMLQT